MLFILLSFLKFNGCLSTGEKELCDRIFMPLTLDRKGQIKVTGTLGGQTVDYQKPILFATGVTKTFIQTDKYIYKPGQTVQFRILTVTGPFLKISKESVSLILMFGYIFVVL